MIAAGDYFRGYATIISFWTTAHFNDRRTTNEFNFSDTHRRSELTFMNRHSGCTIHHFEPAIRSREFRTKHVRVFNIILSMLVIFGGRLNIEMTTFLFIEQGTKYETAVKLWNAHPFYIRLRVDIGDVRAIADYSHFILMYRHFLL